MAALRIAGYVAFFVVFFILSIYWTFPFDLAKDRVLREASRQSKMDITARSLSPSWFTGAVLKGVKIRRPGVEEPIDLTQVHARAHVLPLLSGGQGFTVDLPIAKGEAYANVVQSDEGMDLVAELTSIELALVPGLADATGLPLAGQIDADIDLFNGKDPKNSEGVIKLRGSGLEVLKGGKLSNFPVPEIAIGDFDWTIPVAKGKAQLEKLELKGDALELKIDGSIMLAKQLDRSTLDLKIAFKPTPAFLNKEPLLGALLNNIKRTQDSQGFYNYTAKGFIKQPDMRPAPVRGGRRRRR